MYPINDRWEELSPTIQDNFMTVLPIYITKSVFIGTIFFILLVDG